MKNHRQDARALSRRGFLKRTAALSAGAMAFPCIVPASALGREGRVAPSERITLGFIGIGKMAKGHLGGFLGNDGVQVLAIADVERGRRESQAQRANDYYAEREDRAGYKSCEANNDYRDLCARTDIDAVVIATPNHWHALNAVEAARNGKDIYLEKPLARTIGEGQAIQRAVHRYGRILQVGSQQRSDSAFRFACELVRNGRIGKIHTVHVNVGGPPEEDYLPEETVPEGLDWDFWLGPVPWRPYNSTFAPPESFDGWPRWRYYRDYAGGGMTDFGAHHYDIAQWGLGMDGTGPVEVQYEKGKPITYVYANGIVMHHGGGKPGSAVEWIGEEGRVRVNRGQYLETEPGHLKHETIGPEETHLYQSDNHQKNWIEAIRTRKNPICTVDIGHHTANVCHIGNIAYWLERSLTWDPDNEVFAGDEEANRLIHRPMRAPWQV
ncbi:MAG: Gfo/Idh/MocA family oxidoreductase [Candidatus Hydrogenedentota bacterium]